MDNQGEERILALFRWRERRQRAIVQVVCLIVYWYLIRKYSRIGQIDRSLSLEREKARAKLMAEISTNERSRNIIRMGPKAFLDLCSKLVREGGLLPTQRATVEEQVAKTLYILTHNVRNREIQFWFRRSGETTSRHFHRVLKSLVQLEDKYLKQPDGSQIPAEILGGSRFYPYFKDCIGAIDGTHIRAKVSLEDAPKYRGRKDYPTQNVLAACLFDLKFSYVLPGWEGTASDSRILKNALSREDYLRIPRGSMPKKQVTKGNSCKEAWTNDMDEALVEAYLHQHNLGNRSGNNFTTTAYENIVKELEEKFQREFVKEKVKDRWKNLKKIFSRCYDIFKNGSSGFGWDSTTKRWLATPEVWKNLLAEKPEAAEWMNKPIAHYDKMVILYGKDRATGDNSETAKELKRKRSFIEETQSVDTLDSDQVASRIEVNLDSFHDLDDENAVTSPEARSQGTSQGASSLKPKKKKAKDDKELDGIREALHEVAQALKEGNEVYQRVKQPVPSITEDQVWKLLEDLKIEEHQMDTTYLYLIDHPEKVRAVLGCPQDRRKKILLQMVFGPPNTAR